MVYNVVCVLDSRYYYTLRGCREDLTLLQQRLTTLSQFPTLGFPLNVTLYSRMIFNNVLKNVYDDSFKSDAHHLPKRIRFLSFYRVIELTSPIEMLVPLTSSHSARNFWEQSSAFAKCWIDDVTKKKRKDTFCVISVYRETNHRWKSHVLSSSSVVGGRWRTCGEFVYNPQDQKREDKE